MSVAGGAWQMLLIIKETDMPNWKSSKAFKAGFVACALGVIGIVGYGGDLLFKEFKPEMVRETVNAAKTLVKETFFDEPLFSKPMYVTLYYADETDSHKYQTWKMTVWGRDHIHGEIEALDYGNRGVVDGYWRAGTLNLSYASEDLDRPGIGSFTLRPMYPSLADSGITYAGLGLVHECECTVATNVNTGQVHQGVTSNGPMLIVPALLPTERVPPENIASAFFVKNPVRPDVVWPADLQKTASLTKR
jgi:hypothetical protein